MKETFFTSLGEVGPIIGAGIVIIILFIALRFFRAIFSLSFVGFLGSIYSYTVTDYIFIKIPIIAVVSFVLCLCGFSKSSILCKIFSVCGILLSGYTILTTIGLI